MPGAVEGWLRRDHICSPAAMSFATSPSRACPARPDANGCSRSSASTISRLFSHRAPGSTDAPPSSPPSFRLNYKLHLQIQNLRRTRDLLLPRLLSGQVEFAQHVDVRQNSPAGASKALACEGKMPPRHAKA
jgi:hypothetical protein